MVNKDFQNLASTICCGIRRKLGLILSDRGERVRWIAAESVSSSCRYVTGDVWVIVTFTEEVMFLSAFVGLFVC